MVVEIDSLINVKSYFKASAHFDLNKKELDDFTALRFEATLANVFNQLEKSNQLIKVLFEKYKDSLSKTEERDLLNTQLSNAVKLFDYKQADKITNTLISNYGDVTSPDELKSTKNNGSIWKAVINYPKQSVQFKGDSFIRLNRDKAGLKNLNVVHNSKNYPFIFDTGANLSTIIESQAKSMGIDIIDIEVSVNTITGKRVNSKVGVAKHFTIEHMDFNNVIFLVFPDEALYIPQIDYQINGILGYPVISAMKELHFLEEDNIYIPLESTLDKERNLAIEYLTPLINLQMKGGDEMVFTFDTGADATMLYKSYFDSRKEEVLRSYTKTKIRFGGAGGNTEIEGYDVVFEPVVNHKIIVMDSVSLIPELIKNSDRHSYGNIGQDFISKFDKMVLNFEKMFIHFE